MFLAALLLGAFSLSWLVWVWPVAVQCVSGSLCVSCVLINTYTTHGFSYESDGEDPGFCLDRGVVSSRCANCYQIHTGKCSGPAGTLYPVVLLIAVDTQ